MFVRRFVLAGAALALCLTASAQENPAVKPLNRDIPRHKEFLKIVAKGEGDVIFIGDSITQGWEGKAAKKIWDDAFGAFKPVNLGISGDQTGHVLWRLTEGKEIEPLKPKVKNDPDFVLKSSLEARVTLAATLSSVGHVPDGFASAAVLERLRTR